MRNERNEKRMSRNALSRLSALGANADILGHLLILRVPRWRTIHGVLPLLLVPYNKVRRLPALRIELRPLERLPHIARLERLCWNPVAQASPSPQPPGAVVVDVQHPPAGGVQAVQLLDGWLGWIGCVQG